MKLAKVLKNHPRVRGLVVGGAPFGVKDDYVPSLYRLAVELGIAGDDGTLIVLNGVEVGDTSGWHNNRLVDAIFPITLLPGKNLLMVKVFEGNGGHNLRLRCQASNLTGDVTGDPGQVGVRAGSTTEI